MVGVNSHTTKNSTHLSNVLVPVSEAEQEMRQKMDNVGFKEPP